MFLVAYLLHIGNIVLHPENGQIFDLWLWIKLDTKTCYDIITFIVATYYINITFLIKYFLINVHVGITVLRTSFFNLF